MRPTVQIFHVMTWRIGQTRCIGRILIFANHYYHDHFELLQISPLAKNRVKLRMFVRSNFDFLDRWWASLMRGRLRKAVYTQSIELGKNWTTRCQGS